MTNERGIPEVRVHNAMRLIEKLEAQQALQREEWVALFAAQHDPALRAHLFERARAVRDMHYGRQVFPVSYTHLDVYKRQCAKGSQTCKQATEAVEVRYTSMLEEAYREIVALRGEDALDAITRNVLKIFC